MYTTFLQYIVYPFLVFISLCVSNLFSSLYVIVYIIFHVDKYHTCASANCELFDNS